MSIGAPLVANSIQKCANQNAHEVSRNLTAWALSGIEPILSASMLPSLGPPRPAQHRKSGDCLSARTVDADFTGTAHPTGQLGVLPTGRLWDFAFPGPIPRIAVLFAGRYQPTLALLGPMTRGSEESRLTVA